jgi:hypothetical protein
LFRKKSFIIAEHSSALTPESTSSR